VRFSREAHQPIASARRLAAAEGFQKTTPQHLALSLCADRHEVERHGNLAALAAIPGPGAPGPHHQVEMPAEPTRRPGHAWHVAMKREPCTPRTRGTARHGLSPEKGD
jgi:hypothetical protein